MIQWFEDKMTGDEITRNEVIQYGVTGDKLTVV